MFWGCFSGGTKGPCLFWEEEWDIINAESYSEKIIPLIHGWVRMNPDLLLMQDNAPSHSGKVAQDELLERGVCLIFWPPFSPDLNPIETVWNWMKDYIEAKYGPDLNISYDKLREIVVEAWQSVSEEKFSRSSENNEAEVSRYHRCTGRPHKVVDTLSVKRYSLKLF